MLGDTCHGACVMSDTWHKDLCHSDTCRTHDKPCERKEIERK